MIYIVCPNYVISGGPEASHQLSFYLTKNNIKNKIAYFGKRSKNPIPETYKKYKVEYVWFGKSLDKPENKIIFPEVNINFLRFFNKAQKYIWWLSVDNFFVKRDQNSFKNKFFSVLSGIKNRDFIKILDTTYPKYPFSFSDVDVHFFASFYAESFLIKNNCKNVFPMIEPIGLDFIEHFGNVSLNSKGKSEEILYNPTKDKIITAKLIQKFPDLKFRPIKNLTHKEIGVLFRNSKLYVDFGNFPGPERLPKEAVSMGCCVITSRKGAANFYKDVSIPDEFKFSDDANLEDIYIKIRECLDDYNNIIPKFEAYRQRVYQLESNFEKQIVKNFRS